MFSLLSVLIVMPWACRPTAALSRWDKLFAIRRGVHLGCHQRHAGTWRRYDSYATGVSADGSVVVGYGNSSSGSPGQAFIWDATSGMQWLGNLQSLAYGVSADGSAVVGVAPSSSGWQAFIWDATSGAQWLGALAWWLFLPSGPGASADGSVVVGDSDSSSDARRSSGITPTVCRGW